MPISTKIILVITVIAAACLGFFFVYHELKNAHSLEELQQTIVSQKQLLDNIVRAQSQYASKQDIEAFAKQQNIDLAVIKEDLDTLQAVIKAINAITIVSQNQVETNLASSDTTERPDHITFPDGQDQFGYLNNTQHLKLNEKFSNVEVPIGSVGFSAWKDKPWEVNIAGRKYSITSVLGMDDNGKHYTYSKFSIQVDGKNYDVKIDDNKFLEEYPSSKFSWFNPKVSLLAGAGLITNNEQQFGVDVGAGVSIMSYGKIKSLPDLTFIKPSISYEINSKEVIFGINPIDVNIGQLVNTTLIQNTYIGPMLGISTNKTVFIGSSVGVNF